MGFIIKECKTKATYSVHLHQKLPLELLIKTYDIVLETPILLVVRIADEEIIVHQHGEIFFKTCTDKEKITRIMEDIIHTITPD